VNRIDVRYNGEVVPLTALTTRVLARSGQTVDIASSQDESSNGETAIGDTTLTSLNWEETVLAKQQLIDNWYKLSGEEILAKLESLWTKGKKTTTRADFTQNPDLWLLIALALD
jgi:hypothetical protein